ncbi:universal stress protein [Vibrio mexicanus]|uniref:universal stress protein n=1 Tax=Vibrio mexicanus TaxID=1004326 RepID=UPI00063C8E43|nr:universal stress protein [Vibrio mexicanus]
MKQFNDILFVSQGLTAHQDSLGQSIMLTLRNQANLEGLIACPPLPEHMSDYRETYENSLINTIKTSFDDTVSNNPAIQTPIEFPIHISAGDKPAARISKHVVEHGFDIIIKDTEEIPEGEDGFKALDMQLLRECPCPVWLHKPNNKPIEKRRVAVAIDVDPFDDEKKVMALDLLRHARAIADSSDSRLHIIGCWVYQLESYLSTQAWIKVPEKELNRNIELARIEHLAELNRLIEESGIEGENVIHHLHGEADNEIPRCVANIDIDVLVMGTSARTGLSGVVIGNTAENILQHIHCSLVAFKPRDF